MTLYLIAGKSGPNRSVSLYHTNKHLQNFHSNIEEEVDKVYSSNIAAGIYVAQRGYQNGYDEIGFVVLHIKDAAIV